MCVVTYHVNMGCRCDCGPNCDFIFDLDDSTSRSANLNYSIHLHATYNFIMTCESLILYIFGYGIIFHIRKIWASIFTKRDAFV